MSDRRVVVEYLSPDIKQDLLAMRHAPSWTVVASIARAMRGVGHWCPAAEREYARQARRWGYSVESEAGKQ